MNRYQVFHYMRGIRADGSQVLFDFTNGWDARVRLTRENCVRFVEIQEREFLAEAPNVIHVERCDALTKASSSRTYH